MARIENDLTHGRELQDAAARRGHQTWATGRNN